MTELNLLKHKIPYYWVDKWGNGYWTPRKHMREAGFRNVCCGKNGTAARILAMQWAQRWSDHKSGKSSGHQRPVWPVGSIGEAYERFRQIEEWKRKKPRTREDWDRAWVHIAAAWGDCAPSTITLEHLSLWYSGRPGDATIKPGLIDSIGIREAYRVIKIWRALWQVAASLKYCDAQQDPSKGIRRITPRGRSQRWAEGEIIRLVKRAIRTGRYGLACVVAIMWDTQFSPVDGRMLTARHIKRPTGRLLFDLTGEGDGRAKTGKAALGTLSPRAERLVEAYLHHISGSAQLHPEARLFRTKQGALFTKDLLSKEFRKVRVLEFGKGEERQLIDMRRSGAVEALAGEVDPAILAQKMGNSIHRSRELQKAYFPVSRAVVSIADRARLIGRRRLREPKT